MANTPRAAAALLLAGTLALASAPAQAEDITYEFTGTVLDDSAERGWTSFLGSFTFSTLTPDGIPDPSTGAYTHAGAPYGISITLLGGPSSGTVVSLNSVFTLLVSNNLGGVDELGALASNASGTSTISLTLTDLSGTVFNSDAIPLPLGGLTLADFGFSSFVYEAAAGLLQGRLDSLQCAAGCEPIPEPATWALLGGGLLALGALQRRRNARQVAPCPQARA